MNHLKHFNKKECAIDVKVKMIYDGKNNDIISQLAYYSSPQQTDCPVFSRVVCFFTPFLLSFYSL